MPVATPDVSVGVGQAMAESKAPAPTERVNEKTEIIKGQEALGPATEDVSAREIAIAQANQEAGEFFEDMTGPLDIPENVDKTLAEIAGETSVDKRPLTSSDTTEANKTSSVNADTDRKMEEIKQELILEWETTNGPRWKGNELRPEFQDFMFGDPTAHAVSLEDRVRSIYDKHFPQEAQSEKKEGAGLADEQDSTNDEVEASIGPASVRETDNEGQPAEGGTADGHDTEQEAEGQIEPTAEPSGQEAEQVDSEEAISDVAGNTEDAEAVPLTPEEKKQLEKFKKENRDLVKFLENNEEFGDVKTQVIRELKDTGENISQDEFDKRCLDSYYRGLAEKYAKEDLFEKIKKDKTFQKILAKRMSVIDPNSNIDMDQINKDVLAQYLREKDFRKARGNLFKLILSLAGIAFANSVVSFADEVKPEELGRRR